MIEMFGPMDKSTKSVELNGGFNLNNSFSATRILSPTGYNIEEKGQLLKDIQESPEIIQPYCLVSITQPYRDRSFFSHTSIVALLENSPDRKSVV